MNKLYYDSAYIKEFEAQVLSCQEGKKGWEITLSATAFYPEGGGQPADTGLLGNVRVTDVHEKDGQVVHYTDGPLPVGEMVRGVIDWAPEIPAYAGALWRAPGIRPDPPAVRL